MELLLITLVSGMATGYAVEFIKDLTSTFLSSRLVKRLLAIPLGILFCWLLGLTGQELIVAGVASAFLPLWLMAFLNKETVIERRRGRN